MTRRLMEYDIGDWVRVSAVQRRLRRNDDVLWEEQKTPSFVARVVGAAIRYNGTRCIGGASPLYAPPYEEDRPYLAIMHTHVFYEVRRGFVNKTVLVAAKDMVLCSPSDIGEFPYKWSNPLPYTEDSRNMMRREMAQWPRDERGRWKKETPIPQEVSCKRT